MEKITKVEIGSYRGIRNLVIDDLALCNILTGDNNCGKTSILELLRTVEHPEYISTWNDIRRKIASSDDGPSLYEDFMSFMNVENEELRVEYCVSSGLTSKFQVSMSAQVEPKRMSLEMIRGMQNSAGLGYYKFDNITGKEIKEDHNKNYIIGKANYEIKRNEQPVNSFELYSFLENMNSLLFEEQVQTSNIVYISPYMINNEDSYLDDILDDSQLYEAMMEVLKIFDPNILNITVNKGDNEFNNQRYFKVLSKKHKRALPLNVYGDGMKKAFLILSAAVKARNGMLLIDEFETAIHTSAMDALFTWLLDTCKKLNVQIFMTTHSAEAIMKVLESSEQPKEDIRVITLMKQEGKTVARNLNGEDAKLLNARMGVDLR